MREGRVLDILLAAYRENVDVAAWTSGVMTSLRDALSPGRTTTWFEYKSHVVPDGILLDETLRPVVIGDECEVGTWMRARETLSPALLKKLFGRTLVGTASVTTGSGAQTAKHPAWRKIWREPIVDSFGMVTRDTDGSGVCISVGLDRVTALSARERALLERVAVHVGAGWRLRKIEASDRLERAEAVLDGSGKLLHANDLALQRRSAIDDAHRRREAATKKGEDPEHALDVWRGLVAGRWSLVDHFDSDGKRFVLAIKNPPRVARHLDLTPRERRVCELAARGHRDKEIGYMLGLSAGAVTAALYRARSKLGLRSRVALAAEWQSIAGGSADVEGSG
ncbi:MAG TPA: helix-turn-helix transcriptional regulator [Polyangiaceae bacterium]